jgi:hypothetical protein
MFGQVTKFAAQTAGPPQFVATREARNRGEAGWLRFARHDDALSPRISAQSRTQAHIGSLCGRLRRYHSAIIMRVIVTAVMTEVRIPRPSETAKPRTAPEPNR